MIENDGDFISNQGLIIYPANNSILIDSLELRLAEMDRASLAREVGAPANRARFLTQNAFCLSGRICVF